MAVASHRSLPHQLAVRKNDDILIKKGRLKTLSAITKVQGIVVLCLLVTLKSPQIYCMFHVCASLDEMA